MPARTHKDRVRDAGKRKYRAMFLKVTGRGFDEDWDPTKDRYGSFAADQTKLFQKWAKEDPSKLQEYYNDKRKSVLDAAAAGKNLIHYVKRENGTYTHRDKTDNGEINGAYGTAYDRAGGESGVDELRTNLINQARERVLLGLATKEDLVDLYAYDHYEEPDNSVLGKITQAFNSLFDNDFFDGFRYGFGSVLQLGAPVFDLVPGADDVSGYLDEAGKFIQGDIDSVDTIIGNQNRRAAQANPNFYEGQIIGKAELFDPATELMNDRLREEKELNDRLAAENTEEKRAEYERQVHQDYLNSQGIDENEYYRRAYGKEPPYDMNNPPATDVDAEHEPQAPEDEVETMPILPEGEEFKQAPVIEENQDDWQPGQFNPAAETNQDLAGVNSKLDKLQADVSHLTGLVNRAKQRKSKFQESGGALGDRKRKPERDLYRDKPMSPADKAELERLSEAYNNARTQAEAARIVHRINAIIAKYGGHERRDEEYIGDEDDDFLTEDFDDHVGGGLKRRRKGYWYGYGLRGRGARPVSSVVMHRGQWRNRG